MGWEPEGHQFKSPSGPNMECGLVAGEVPVHPRAQPRCPRARHWTPNCSGHLSIGSPLCACVRIWQQSEKKFNLPSGINKFYPLHLTWCVWSSDSWSFYQRGSKRQSKTFACVSHRCVSVCTSWYETHSHCSFSKRESYDVICNIWVCSLSNYVFSHSYTPTVCNSQFSWSLQYVLGMNVSFLTCGIVFWIDKHMCGSGQFKWDQKILLSLAINSPTYIYLIHI